MSKPDFQIYTETLPPGALPSADGDWGDLVYYIDKNLEIREVRIGPSKRFMGFLVPNVDDTMIAFLKDALRKNDPHAQEIRHIVSPDGFFMFSIYHVQTEYY